VTANCQQRFPFQEICFEVQTLVSAIDQIGVIACSKLAVGVSPGSGCSFAVQNSSTKSSAQKATRGSGDCAELGAPKHS
jgi:hypothetical protein